MIVSPAMAQENSSNGWDLLTEFGHDLICRVVPGALVLALYGGKEILRFYSTQKESTILISVALFIAAWLIGVTIELMTYSGPALREKKLNPDAFKKGGLLEKVPVWSWSGLHRRQFLKVCAEKVMYRAIVTIAIAVVIYPPSQLRQWNYFATIAIAVLIAVVFGLGWMWSRSNPLTKEELEGTTPPLEGTTPGNAACLPCRKLTVASAIVVIVLAAAIVEKARG